VDKVLHELQPPLNKESLKQNLVPWLNDIRMCQNTVNSILSLSSQSQWVHELKLSWQLIQAMRMFLEHVMLHHTKVSVKYARRLEMVSVIILVTKNLTFYTRQHTDDFNVLLLYYCILLDIKAVWT
jgi:hypothetical protein